MPEPTTAKAVDAEAPNMTLAEAAERYGVSERSLRRRIAEGRLPAYRIGPRTIRVVAADVRALSTRIPTAGDAA